MSNIMMSIQVKLKQLSKASNKNHQLMLTRYFQERLLFRLSISKYKSNFFLKGGALIYALEKEASRPTLDIDLLAKQISADQIVIADIFKTIANIPYHADGVVFDSNNLEIAEIIKNEKYSGIRVKLMATLGKIKQRTQIDIGFGDIIFPKPIEMEYPTLLKMENPVIYVYSIESLIAEKFEAMIDLSEANSRMKDFYDVFKILEKGNFAQNHLSTAIEKTFAKRKTALVKNHPLFTESFANDEFRNKQWQAFLRKANLDTNLKFSEVMAKISDDLRSVYNEISESTQK